MHGSVSVVAYLWYIETCMFYIIEVYEYLYTYGILPTTAASLLLFCTYTSILRSLTATLPPCRVVCNSLILSSLST